MKSILLLVCFNLYFLSCSSIDYREENIKAPDPKIEARIKEIYTNAKLDKVLSFSIFRMGMLGYYNMKGLAPTAKLIVIDFSKPSIQERLYVIDVKKEKLLYQSLVAHGVNSGSNIATSFSNTPDSRQSSLGFYITGETYEGKYGYSLRLDGVEQGVNHNARSRAIVMHAADYVSQAFVQKNGRLGRSWGCPALPKNLSKELINSIKNKSCLFIYAKDKQYLKTSKYILK